MAKRLARPNRYGGTTDHSEEIARLQLQAGAADTRLECLVFGTAAELLLGHDQTGISLDEWLAPRMLVEELLGEPILDNGI